MSHRSIRSRKGQVTVEVAILFGVVVAALVAMAAYVQRGMAGGMRSNADSLGTQYQPTAGLEVHTRSTNSETGGTTLSAQKTKTCQGLGGTPMPEGCDAASVTTPCLPGADGTIPASC